MVVLMGGAGVVDGGADDPGTTIKGHPSTGPTPARHGHGDRVS